MNDVTPDQDGSHNSSFSRRLTLCLMAGLPMARSTSGSGNRSAGSRSRFVAREVDLSALHQEVLLREPEPGSSLTNWLSGVRRPKVRPGF
jgi:hypothetical protein